MKTFITSTLILCCLTLMSQDKKTDYNQDLATLNKQISENTDNIDLYLKKANIYNHMNEFSKADKNYEKVIQMYEKHPDQQYKETYAEACLRQADDHFFRTSANDEALRYVRTGLKEAPDHKALETMEAIIMADMDIENSSARERFEALTQKYPEDVRLLSYYGQFLEDKPMEAAKQYEKIIALDPSNEKVLTKLGVLYNNEASNMADTTTDPGMVYNLASQAADYFEKAHQLNPEDEELTTIITRLKAELDNEPDEPVDIKKVPF